MGAARAELSARRYISAVHLGDISRRYISAIDLGSPQLIIPHPRRRAAPREMLPRPLTHRPPRVAEPQKDIFGAKIARLRFGGVGGRCGGVGDDVWEKGCDERSQQAGYVHLPFTDS